MAGVDVKVGVWVGVGVSVGVAVGLSVGVAVGVNVMVGVAVGLALVKVQSMASAGSMSIVALRLARSTVVPPSGSVQVISVNSQPLVSDSLMV